MEYYNLYYSAILPNWIIIRGSMRSKQTNGGNMRSIFIWLLMLAGICFLLNLMLLTGNDSFAEHEAMQNHVRLRHPNQKLDEFASNQIPENETGKINNNQVKKGNVYTPNEFREIFDSKKHNRMQKKIVSAMRWAWDGYKKHAYGHDALDVIEMKGTGLPGHDMAISLIDSLDTLYIMGMEEEFDEAAAWAEKHMAKRYEMHVKISIFETTIRILGGLLSAYNFSGRRALLTLADDLGARIMKGLDGPHKFPLSLVDLIVSCVYILLVFLHLNMF